MNDHANKTTEAYFEWLRKWAEEDKKVVLLLIGFNLAIVSLVLSEKLFSAQPKSVLVAGAVVLFMSAAAFLYRYFHALHIAIRQILPMLLDEDTTAAANTFEAVWKKTKWWFRIGTACTAGGLILLLAAYINLLAA